MHLINILKTLELVEVVEPYSLRVRVPTLNGDLINFTMMKPFPPGVHKDRFEEEFAEHFGQSLPPAKVQEDSLSLLRNIPAKCKLDIF